MNPVSEAPIKPMNHGGRWNEKTKLAGAACRLRDLGIDATKLSATTRWRGDLGVDGTFLAGWPGTLVCGSYHQLGIIFPRRDWTQVAEACLVAVATSNLGNGGPRDVGPRATRASSHPDDHGSRRLMGQWTKPPTAPCDLARHGPMVSVCQCTELLVRTGSDGPCLY